MANEYRVILDGKFGTLSANAAVSATTMQSAAFASLPTYATTMYSPITLRDDQTGVFEVVWITGHNAGSQSVTVLRGREGTSAQPWPQFTAWGVAPTVRDAVPLLDSRTALPADGHVDMTAVLRDEGCMVVKTYDQGWFSPVGVMRAANVKNANQTPAQKTLLVQTQRFDGNTNGSGNIRVNWNMPFPTTTLNAFGAIGTGGNGNTVRLDGLDASGTSWSVRFNSGEPAANTGVVVHVLGLGY